MLGGKEANAGRGKGKSWEGKRQTQGMFVLKLHKQL